jgi:hypothetical protein
VWVCFVCGWVEQRREKGKEKVSKKEEGIKG